MPRTPTRKVIDLDELTTEVNNLLTTADSTLRLDGLTPEQAFRLGAASLLERIKRKTGTYLGFVYSGSELLPGGRGLKPGYDDTRRRYF